MEFERVICGVRPLLLRRGSNSQLKAAGYCNANGKGVLTAKMRLFAEASQLGKEKGKGKGKCISAVSSEEPAVRVMFAAGGTGGHVFPAIAIADALSTAQKSVIVQFVGTKDRIEASAVPCAGYLLHHIPAVPLRRPVILSPQNLLLPFRLLISILVAIRLLLRFRPHVVVGTGGYVSGPVCFAALLCGCSYVIQEQNAYPGLANKILACFATSVFVAFSGALVHFPSRKCVVCGNPVRSTLQNLVPKAIALSHFFPNASLLSAETTQDADVPYEVILIQGGSMGAKTINHATIGFIKQMLDTHPKRFLIWQTGSRHFKDVVDKIKGHERMHITKFLRDMNLAYSAADLVVTCSGAITCSELLLLGKPSVLIPLRYVVNNHQQNNAAVLQKAGASRVLDDEGLTPQKLEATINELLADKVLLAMMGKNALQAAAPNAAGRIARDVYLIAKTQALKGAQRGCFLVP